MAASRRDSKFDNGRVVSQYIIDQPKTFYDEPSPTSSAFSVDIQDCKLPTSPPATLASPWRHSQTLDYFQDTNLDKADVLFDIEQGSPSTRTTRWPTSLSLSSGLGISSPTSSRAKKIQRNQSQSTKKPAPVTNFLSSFRPSRLAAALRSTVQNMYSGSPAKKSCPSTPLASAPSYLNSESVLMLSLRASGDSEVKSNGTSIGDSPRLYAPPRSSVRSKSKTATLPIPATSSRRSKADHEKALWSRHIDAATSKTSSSPHSNTSSTSRRAPPPPFDDEVFFLQLRESYTHLRGGSLWRTCSARSLQRITVQGRGPQDFARPSRSSCDLYSCYSSSKLEILSPTFPTSANGDSGSSSSPSPTASTFPILSDDPSSPPTTKDQTASTLLALFRDPALGRDHTTHVQWARRIANMPTLRIVPPHNDGCDPDPDDAAADADVEGQDRFAQEGLVFEIGFSWRRIVAAVGLVLLAAVLVGSAAGPGAVLGIGAASAVSAVLLGGCVLLAGLAAVAVWLGVSWMML